MKPPSLDSLGPPVAARPPPALDSLAPPAPIARPATPPRRSGLAAPPSLDGLADLAPPRAAPRPGGGAPAPEPEPAGGLDEIDLPPPVLAKPAELSGFKGIPDPGGVQGRALVVIGHNPTMKVPEGQIQIRTRKVSRPPALRTRPSANAQR